MNIEFDWAVNFELRRTDVYNDDWWTKTTHWSHCRKMSTFQNDFPKLKSNKKEKNRKSSLLNKFEINFSIMISCENQTSISLSAPLNQISNGIWNTFSWLLCTFFGKPDKHLIALRGLRQNLLSILLHLLDLSLVSSFCAFSLFIVCSVNGRCLHWLFSLHLSTWILTKRSNVDMLAASVTSIDLHLLMMKQQTILSTFRNSIWDFINKSQLYVCQWIKQHSVCCLDPSNWLAFVHVFHNINDLSSLSLPCIPQLLVQGVRQQRFKYQNIGLEYAICSRYD